MITVSKAVNVYISTMLSEVLGIIARYMAKQLIPSTDVWTEQYTEADEPPRPNYSAILSACTQRLWWDIQAGIVNPKVLQEFINNYVQDEGQREEENRVRIYLTDAILDVKEQIGAWMETQPLQVPYLKTRMGAYNIRLILAVAALWASLRIEQDNS